MMTLAYPDPATWALRGRVLAYVAEDLLDPWPSQQVRALRAMFDQGLSYGLMARRIGRSRNAVMSKVYRLKWRRTETTRVVRRSDAGPPRPPRRQEPRLKAKPAPAKGVSLFDLARSGCKFPTGETASGWLFCGEARQDGSPYCTHHHKRCHRPKVTG